MRDSITVAYARIRQELPRGYILLFRIRDFYEAMGDVAQTVASVCGTRPTLRWGTVFTAFAAERIDTMLAKLIRCGKRVALAERNIGERWEVTRVITPGGE